MSKGGRLATVFGLFLVVVGLVVWAVAALLTPGVPGGVVNYTNTQAAGQPVQLTVQTVGSIGFGPHPTWVSYLTKDPKTGKWEHETTWKLPAHTLVDMTVYQYDSGSPLRNQEWGAWGSRQRPRYASGSPLSSRSKGSSWEEGLGRTWSSCSPTCRSSPLPWPRPGP